MTIFPYQCKAYAPIFSLWRCKWHRWLSTSIARKTVTHASILTSNLRTRAVKAYLLLNPLFMRTHLVIVGMTRRECRASIAEEVSKQRQQKLRNENREHIQIRNLKAQPTCLLQVLQSTATWTCLLRYAQSRHRSTLRTDSAKICRER